MNGTQLLLVGVLLWLGMMWHSWRCVNHIIALGALPKRLHLRWRVISLLFPLAFISMQLYAMLCKWRIGFAVGVEVGLAGGTVEDIKAQVAKTDGEIRREVQATVAREDKLDDPAIDPEWELPRDDG